MGGAVPVAGRGWQRVGWLLELALGRELNSSPGCPWGLKAVGNRGRSPGLSPADSERLHAGVEVMADKGPPCFISLQEAVGPVHTDEGALD
ncbi:MAG: hypothetical protein RLZZ206_1764 [Cyanobacteriota bacterium]